MNQVLQIDPPVRGIWKALRSPGHHRFAYDFAAAKEHGKLFSVSKVRLVIGKTAVENSFGWSKPVYSPVNGKVVAASDGWPDRQNLNLLRDLINVFVLGMLQAQKAREDLRIFAGNYVIIASQGLYVLLAHLRNRSLTITSDQNISRGQQVASVGCSGNSAAPHLHLQVNSGRNLLDSKIIEFGFTQFDRWTGESWETAVKTPPIKGDLMRFND